MCCLEKVGAMPGQGVTSMFNFGVSYGYIKGVLEANRIPYQEIPPQRWKKEFGLNSDKAASVEVCRKLFPDVNLLATPRCRKPHDGMAEALLLAEYARRKL
jgi:crossover junction endodeoxyribonuclease RuvC